MPVGADLLRMGEVQPKIAAVSAASGSARMLQDGPQAGCSRKGSSSSAAKGAQEAGAWPLPSRAGTPTPCWCPHPRNTSAQALHA